MVLVYGVYMITVITGIIMCGIYTVIATTIIMQVYRTAAEANVHPENRDVSITCNVFPRTTIYYTM